MNTEPFDSVERLNAFRRIMEQAATGDPIACLLLQRAIVRLLYAEDVPLRYLMAVCETVANLREDELEKRASGN